MAAKQNAVAILKLFMNSQYSARVVDNMNGPIFLSQQKNNSGQSPIHVATIYNAYDILSELLKFPGININDGDGRGMTALHIAVENNHNKVVYLLLERGADVNTIANTKRRPIHESGNTNILRMLLEHGADPLHKDEFGRIPFHVAAINNKIDVLKYFLQVPEDDCTRDWYITVKNFAVTVGETEVGIFFMKQMDKYSSSPLHLAAKNNRTDAVNLLLKNGADLLSKNNYGLTPMHFAAWDNAVDVLEFLLTIPDGDISSFEGFAKIRGRLGDECDADDIRTFLLNQVDNHSNTPLHLAAKNNRTDAVNLLLKHGADLLSKNGYGHTPMHVAAQDNALDVLELLLTIPDGDISSLEGFANIKVRLGAKCNAGDIRTFLLNQVDDYSNTPLHLAAKNNHTDAVNLLLKHGADLLAKCKYGNTPMHYAAHNNAVDVLEFLLTISENENISNLKGFQIIKELAEANSESRIEKFLIEQENRNSETPLQLAAKKNANIEAVQLLVQNGANLLARNKHGRTSVHVAVKNDAENILQFLLRGEYGANNGRYNAISLLQQTDHIGQSPLHLAVTSGHRGIVELLLHYGADLSLKDNRGMTPITIAQKCRKTDIVNLLQSHA